MAVPDNSGLEDDDLPLPDTSFRAVPTEEFPDNGSYSSVDLANDILFSDDEYTRVPSDEPHSCSDDDLPDDDWSAFCKSVATPCQRKRITFDPDVKIFSLTVENMAPYKYRRFCSADKKVLCTTHR